MNFTKAAAKSGGPRDKGGRRVLIVEDEQLVALYLVEFLEDLGYGAAVASSATAALESALTHRPALALIDLTLAYGEDGVALARELRDQFGTEIIFLTGAMGPDAEDQMTSVQPVAILAKPCNQKELRAAISKGMAMQEC